MNPQSGRTGQVRWLRDIAQTIVSADTDEGRFLLQLADELDQPSDTGNPYRRVRADALTEGMTLADGRVVASAGYPTVAVRFRGADSVPTGPVHYSPDTMLTVVRDGVDAPDFGRSASNVSEMVDPYKRAAEIRASRSEGER